MKHSTLLFILLYVCVHEPLVAQNKAAGIDTLLSRLNRQNLFNGAIVVGQHDSILLSKGYGYANFSNDAAFTPDTPADGGSIAETFTAAAMLLLAEQQKLNLLDSVQQYIPDYPYAHTQLWNLLTHSTGGLPDYIYFFEKIPATDILSNQNIINILSQHKPPLLYAPDTNFSYDSPGFDIAAAIVERVSGLSFQRFLSTHFLDPLKMHQSYIRPPVLSVWPGERAKGYTYENEILELADIGDREGFYGGSNIWFSATDLYRWGKSFYNRPIPDESLLPVITSWVSIKGKLSAMRLGAWYQGRNSNAHYAWGSVAGFYSFLYSDAQKQFTIAFVSNTNLPQWIRPQLTAAMLDIIEGQKEQPLAEPQADRITQQQLSAITGKYKVDKVGTIEIYLKEGTPHIKLPTDMEYKILQPSPKTFYIPGLDTWLSFSKRQDTVFQNLLWRTSHSQATGTRLAE